MKRTGTKIVSLSIYLIYNVMSTTETGKEETQLYRCLSYCYSSILPIYVYIGKVQERKRSRWMRAYIYIRMYITKNIVLYIWNKLVVRESDITIFVQIQSTHQWSSFSRMILWWSDCSASASVFVQLTSNVVKSSLYMMKKSLSKLLRQTCQWSSIYRYSYHMNTNELHINDITNGKDMNAVENDSTYASM